MPTSTGAPTATPTYTPSPTPDPRLFAVVTWNLESGGADPVVIAARLPSLGPADLWAFQEVNPTADQAPYEQTIEAFTGRPYTSILGASGGGDRLLALYNADRFDELGRYELDDVNTTGNARAPLLLHLRNSVSDQEFLFVVNHLYRTRNEERHVQSCLLNHWARSQTLPVLAVGDYIFDWSVSGSADHDRGYDLLTQDDVFIWLRPARLVTTQCSGWPCAHQSILDFVFTAGDAQAWPGSATIVEMPDDFPDDDSTPDHRPIQAAFIPDSEPIARVPAPAAILHIDSSIKAACAQGSTAAETPGTRGGPTVQPATETLHIGITHFDGGVPRRESDEYIEIVNDGQSVNLLGYRLADEHGRVFLFPDHFMDTGERCRVYTNQIHAEHCGFSIGSGSAIWNNDGEIATLFGPDGAIVDQKCWAGRDC